MVARERGEWHSFWESEKNILEEILFENNAEG